MTLADDVSAALCEAHLCHALRTQQDVVAALRAYPSLTVCVEYEGGTGLGEPRLRGTLPIAYNGTTYNIPIALHLNEHYPAAPPLAVVPPTPGLALDPNHRHVDGHSGRCYLPYLSSWSEYGSNLVGLCQELVAVFSQKPPVYAQPTANPHPPRPSPPFPGASSSSSRGAPSPPPAYVYHPYPHPKDAQAMRLEEDQQFLLAKVQSLKQAVDAEADAAHMRLLADKTALTDQHHSLQAEVEHLRREQGLLPGVLGRLEGDLHAAESWLRDHGALLRGALDVDGAAAPRLPIVLQLQEAEAEDRAWEDVLYHLNQHLDSPGLAFDLWLKNVRHLSRKQFEARALGLECKRRVAQLPPGPPPPPLYPSLGA